MTTITRIFEFDAAHRVMNEKVKCFNLHGHRFKVEVTLEYGSKEALGYAIDFKEIKRLVGDWIDEHLDHACILNPKDYALIDLCKGNGWKLHIMGLGVSEDINPSAENLASELFYVISRFFSKSTNGISLEKIRLYETPNCWVETGVASYSGTLDFDKDVDYWRLEKGDFNYDIREDYYGEKV